MSFAEKIGMLRRARQLTQGELATILGVAQSTISRWESDKQGPRVEELIAIHDWAGEDWADPQHPGLAEAARAVNEIMDETGLFRDRVPIVGHVCAGEWRETFAIPENEQAFIMVPTPEKFQNLRRFGVLVDGTSMDQAYRHGSILICVKMIDYGEEPVHGQKVIVFRYRRDRTVEATVKEYVKDLLGRPWLWPRSHDPEHQLPINITKPDDQDIEEISVYGLVIASYRIEVW